MNINYKGHTFDFLIHDQPEHVSSAIAENGEWEPALSDLWYNHINAGDLVIDIGANLGWYTKLANLKGATCIAIEPEPNNFTLLQKNCDENNEFYNICAGKDTTDIKLKLSKDNNFGDHRTSIDGDITCKQNTIDNIVGDRANKIRAIKIDTQGWEPNIILGAINTLKNVSDDCLLIIEYWPYGLHQNNFSQTAYDDLFNIFKSKPIYYPSSKLDYDLVKHDPHQHRDIVLYKKDKLKINIGAGRRRFDGFVNCDYSDLFNPEYIFDLEKDIWPFEDNSVDEVYAHHVLEHMGEGYFHCLQELYRVCKADAIVDIRVPHYKNENQFHDPTHRRFITVIGLTLFDQEYNLAGPSTSSKLGLQFGVNFKIISESHTLNQGHPRLNELKEKTDQEIAVYAHDKVNVYCETHIVMRVVK